MRGVDKSKAEARFYLLSVLGHRSQPRAEVHKGPKSWDHSKREASQERRARADTQVREERLSEQRECSGDTRPEKVVTCEDTSHIVRVGDRKVDEGGLEEEVDTRHIETSTDDGPDPVHIASRRPSKDEQGDGDKDPSDHRETEVFLGRCFPLDGVEARVEVVLEVEDIEEIGGEGANDNADEWQSGDATLEAVDLSEHEREGLEPQVEDRVTN